MALWTISSFAWGAVEIGGNFGYDRQIYGEDRASKVVSRTYSGFWAWYLFSATAIELNYTQNENITTQNAKYIDNDGDTVYISLQEKVLSNVYGIGIRQGLSGNKARIQPMISLGYAKQFVRSSTNTTYSLNGVSAYYYEKDPSQRSDNVFAAFILKLYLSKRFSLNGSVKTVFRAFEFDEAEYNLKYLAGFSWIF